MNNKNDIELTPQAALFLLGIMKNKGLVSCGLRFADDVSACGFGYDHTLDLVATPELQDEVFKSCNILIYVPKSSLIRLVGTVIDYNTSAPELELNENWLKKLKIHNPNANWLCTCGCGDGG